MLGATQRRLRSLLPLFAARPTRTLVVSSLRSQQQRRRERQNHFDPQPKTKYLRSSNKEEKPSPTVVQSLKDSAVDGIRVSGERKVNPADAVPKFNEANRAHIKKASEFLESKFGLKFKDEGLLLASLTDYQYWLDKRRTNGQLSLMGRSVLRLILADMRVTASLQANPNETQNSPAYQEYLADVDSQVRRFIAPSRLTFTAYHLGMMPLFRFSVEKALSEQAPAENYLYKSITDKAAAASNNVSVTAIKEKADRKHIITMFATARGFLAFIGALYLDQGEEVVRKFFFTHLQPQFRYRPTPMKTWSESSGVLTGNM